jgi:hypothetical protein
MAIYHNGIKLNWYEANINVNGTVISSNEDLNDVYHNGTKVHGSSNFASETQLYSFGIAPDSRNLPNVYVPALISTYAAAFDDYGYETYGGTDYRWYYRLNVGYRFVTSDGTFTGGTEPLSWNGETWTGYLWEGRSVTGASTSHNGGTNCYLRRDNGV